MTKHTTELFKRFYSEREIAEYTGFTVKKLQQDRFLHKGFPYVKIGRAVKYDINEVNEYLESGRIAPEEVD